MLNLLLLQLIARAEIGPLVEPGSNEGFHRAVYSVQKDLAASKFTDAAAKAKRLPDLEIKLQWDDKGVPTQLKPAFNQAKEKAIREWQVQVDGLKISEVKSGPEILVNFTQALGPNADSSVPRGAAFSTNYLGTGPTLETTIALTRGKKLLPSNQNDIGNDLMFAIGTYLGLERLPLSTGIMTRAEEPSNFFRRMDRTELYISKANLQVVAKLRSLAKAKTVIRPSAAKLAMNPLRIDLPKIVQGNTGAFTVTLTNQGNVPLHYAFVPDCGCFILPKIVPIKPGDTISQTIRIDTLDFMGQQAKNIFVYSNDPDFPVRVLPVKYYSQPRFRFLWEEKQNVLQVDENGRAVSVYLTYPEDKPFKVKNIAFGGAPGVSSWKIWEGIMADPDLKEPAKLRKGYKINMLFSSNIGEGRRPVTLDVFTDDELFPTMRHQFFLQQGIIMDPPVMYVGNAKVGSSASSILSRPGKPFKILKFESKSGAIGLKYEDIGKQDEFRIVVVYKGGLTSGDWNEEFKIFTDDPKQPVIEGRAYVVIP